MCLCHFFLIVHHALFPTHGAAQSRSLFPISFPSLKEFWEPISFPSFFPFSLSLIVTNLQLREGNRMLQFLKRKLLAGPLLYDSVSISG